MVVTKQTKEQVNQNAIQYMSSKDYKLVSQSENMLTFEDGRDTKGWIMILAILFFLVGAIIYHFMSTKHTITITYTETEDGLSVQTTTTTQKSMQIATEFVNTL